MPVIFLTITAEGRDGANYDGGNSADADRDNTNNKVDQHASRKNGAVCPANSNRDNDDGMFYM